MHNYDLSKFIEIAKRPLSRIEKIQIESCEIHNEWVRVWKRNKGFSMDQGIPLINIQAMIDTGNIYLHYNKAEVRYCLQNIARLEREYIELNAKIN